MTGWRVTTCRLCACAASGIFIALLLRADVWFGDTTQRVRLLIETQREGIAFGGLWPRYRVTALENTNGLPIDTVYTCVLHKLDLGKLSNEFFTVPEWILEFEHKNTGYVQQHVSAPAVHFSSADIATDADDTKVRRCRITAICNALTAEVYLAIITPGTDTDGDWIPNAWERMYLDADGVYGAYDPALDSGNARLEPLADGTNNLVRFILGLGADLANSAAHGLRIQPAYYPVLLRGNNNILSFTASVLRQGVWRNEPATWQFAMPGYTSAPKLEDPYWPAWNDAIVLGSFGNRQWTANGVSCSVRSARGIVRAWTEKVTNAIPFYAAEWKLSGLLRAEDTDKDGMPDTWESLFGAPFDASVNDAALDFDGDGIVNVEEFLRGLSPVAADTDGDGIDDARELELGLNPLLADTDADGIPDGWDIVPRGANPAPVIVVESPPPGATI